MVCPIIGYSVDERGARVVAGFVALVVATALLAPGGYATALFALLAVDFGFRAFSRPRWSVLSRLAGWSLRGLGVAPCRVDAGPKRFAARIGLVFVLVLLAGTWIAPHAFVQAAGSVLVLFALLEALLGFCVGCHAWTLWYALGDRILPGNAR